MIPAFVELLQADADQLKTWMCRNSQLAILIIRRWHPHRQAAVVDKRGIREVEDV